jgi:acetylglutamate synthase
MKKETHTISFRLDTHYLLSLEQRATNASLSVHEAARQMVIERLEDAERHRVLEEVLALRTLLEKLRNDLAETLVTVLVEIGEVDEDESRRYVTAYLRNR